MTAGQYAGISAASGMLSAGGNIISTLLANRANRKLAEYSYEQQRQMIREQNEYNSPLNQMARYKEAGLNPNLMFGNIENGNQAQLAKYDAPTMQAPNIDADITSAMQLMLMAKKNEAEIANINSQTQRNQEETRAAMLRNNWESFVSGKPVEGWTYDNSRKLQQYDLGLQSQSIVNTMHKVQTDVERLNAKEKRFFIETLLPLSVRLKHLEIKGATYDNMMKAVDTTIWRDKRSSEINATPYRIFGRLLDTILTETPPTVRHGLVKPKNLYKGPDGRIWYKGSRLLEWH